MNPAIRLVLAIHNHQPVGNFEDVFENAYRDSYAPFLDVLDDFPELCIALHTSGCLMEWLAEAHPEYIDRLRLLVERGQVEIVGGAFYEPILSGIPRRDRIGQIRSYSQYLQKLFGTNVRGMWVPERVWEQSFASDIVEAGIEYTVLDDFHFQNAGLREEDLHGYYLTEDEGALFKIFPGSERLRYAIPFADPQKTIDHLGQIAARFPNTVVTFGDDGEKFGTWPETKKHVYTDGWLRRFFEALKENSDWVKVTTLSETVDHLPPVGKCYLPDSSYREMTEWALPAERQIEYMTLREKKQDDSDWPRLKQFLRGGFWRNFRVRYPEANEMYVRMLEISRRLEEMTPSETPADAWAPLNRARTELYRAQCNCSYWHGAFGGLYLPHLRHAVFEHLIAADSLLETAAGRTDQWVEVNACDYDLDARKEIRLANNKMVAYLAPGRGGHLYEWDIRQAGRNLLATLNRRPEAYHQTVQRLGQQQHAGEVGGDTQNTTSIHDLVRFKQPDLHEKLIYDEWPRKSLVDHFLQPGLDQGDFQQGRGSMGDFVTGVYQSRLRRSAERVEVCMHRDGRLGPYEIHVVKTVALDAGGGTLEVRYEMENLPNDVPIHFGVEFQFAGMAAGAADRYFYDEAGQQLGPLETVQSLPAMHRIGLIDEWLGLETAIDVFPAAQIWTFPIETISQSEGGFEMVHQSSLVLPHWEFTADDGRWSGELKLSVDTSAAEARRLREAAETREISPG